MEPQYAGPLGRWGTPPVRKMGKTFSRREKNSPQYPQEDGTHAASDQTEPSSAGDTTKMDRQPCRRVSDSRRSAPANPTHVALRQKDHLFAGGAVSTSEWMLPQKKNSKQSPTWDPTHARSEKTGQQHVGGQTQTEKPPRPRLANLSPASAGEQTTHAQSTWRRLSIAGAATNMVRRMETAQPEFQPSAAASHTPVPSQRRDSPFVGELVEGQNHRRTSDLLPSAAGGTTPAH